MTSLAEARALEDAPDHGGTIRGGVPVFACDSCPRTFGSAQGLAVHWARMHKPAEEEVDVEEEVEEEVDPDQLLIDLDDGDRDVLDALAFLHRLENGLDYVVHLVNNAIATHRDDDDVKLLLTARRCYLQEHPPE